MHNAALGSIHVQAKDGPFGMLYQKCVLHKRDAQKKCIPVVKSDDDSAACQGQLCALRKVVIRCGIA